MLIITCHPDDWEIGMGGTAYLMKDRFQIHVIIASDGELGNTWNTTGLPDSELAETRQGHSKATAEKIGAINYFLHLPDGGVHADEQAVNQVVELLEEIDPQIIFLHWPLDKPDHAAAGTMALMALSRTGMHYSREAYFFEVGHCDHFAPEVYVDISDVGEVKRNLVHIHERFGDDRLVQMAEKNARHQGYANRCTYAEGFMSLIPFSHPGSTQEHGCALPGWQ